jgi:hypothetical protein
MRSVLVFVIGGAAVASIFASMTWLVVIAVTLCGLAVALNEQENDQLRAIVDRQRDELARYKGERVPDRERLSEPAPPSDGAHLDRRRK